MKRNLLVAFMALMIAGGLAGTALPQLPQITPAFGTLASNGAQLTTRCANGSSTADIYIAGTLSGTVTVNTASDVSMSPGSYQPGVYGAPLWVTGSGGTTNVATISSFPGHLYVTLAAQPWVQAIITSYSSGSATAEITCSMSVARVGNLPSGGSGGGSPLPSFSASPPVMVATPTGQVNYSCWGTIPSNTCLYNPVPYLVMGAWAFPSASPVPSNGTIYWGDSAHPTASPNGPTTNWSATSTYWTTQFPPLAGNCTPGPDIRMDTNGDFGIDDLCAAPTTPYTVTIGSNSVPAANPNTYINNLNAGFTSPANIAYTSCTLSAQACTTPTLSPLPPNIQGANTSLCQGVIDKDHSSTSSGAIYNVAYSQTNYQFTVQAGSGVTGSVRIDYWCPD